MMLELRIEIMCVLITSSIVYTANGVNFVATVSKEQLNVFSFVSLSSLVVELIYMSALIKASLLRVGFTIVVSCASRTDIKNDKPRIEVSNLISVTCNSSYCILLRGQSIALSRIATARNCH